MTDDERDAYSRGLSRAYDNVFKAFTIAFEEGQDIHWLRERITAQWDAFRATPLVRGQL